MSHKFDLAVTGLYLWRGHAGRTVLRVAFAGEIGGRLEGAVLDRSIIRTMWLDREEIAARSGEHRSPLVLQCIEDHVRGVRYPLELLNHVALEGGRPLPAVAG